MPNQSFLRYRHCTWAFVGLAWNPFADLLLGRTGGTKSSISKYHAHVSSPQVPGRVEDSGRDFQVVYLVVVVDLVA